MTNWRSRAHQWASSCFAIDPRSLAVARVGLALVLLVVLTHAFDNASTFYADSGLMPRDWLVRILGEWRFTLLAANGTLAFTLLFIGVQWLLALMLLLGWYTRPVTILSWLLLASLQTRDPLILTNGDHLLLLMLFWGMFQPWSAHYSVDAALSRTEQPGAPRFTWASAGMTIQIVSVYFFGSLLRSGAAWWPDGTAAYDVLSMDRYATGLGQYMLHFPGLLQVLTYGAYLLGLTLPLLIYSPIFNSALRMIASVGLVLFNLGLILFLNLGIYPWVALIAAVLLAGDAPWNWLQRRASLGRGVTVYYNGDCRTCAEICLLLRTFLIIPHAEVEPAQNTRRAQTLMAANASWVIVDAHDNAHLKWAALLVLLRESPLCSWWLSPLLSPEKLSNAGDRGFQFLSKHASRIEAFASRLRLLPQPSLSLHSGPAWLPAIALILITVWNLTTVGALPTAFQQTLAPVFKPLRLDQRWNDFAPTPPRDDGWFVAPGLLKNGKQVDVLLPGSAINYEQAGHLAQLRDQSTDWRSYESRIRHGNQSRNFQLWSSYLCRHWNDNATPARRLIRLDITYVLRRIMPPGQQHEIERHELWAHNCASDSTQDN